MSSVKGAKHAVYDTKYHLVWIPEYRKNIFNRVPAGITGGSFDEIQQKQVPCLVEREGTHQAEGEIE